MINRLGIGRKRCSNQAIGSAEPEGILNIVVERAGQQREFNVKPELMDQVPKIGIVAEIAYERSNPLVGIGLGFTRTVELTWAMVEGLGVMITVGVEPDVAGPVGITQMIGEAARGAGFS